MQAPDTVSDNQNNKDIPYQYPTDTVSIPSGEYGIGNMEDGNRNREGEVNAPAQARAKPPKKKYGQFQNVLLTEEEYEKLVDHFGSQEVAATWISRLDEYIGSKGAKYKSHYITILNWERKDAETQHAAPTNYSQQLKFEQDQQARALLAASQKRREHNAQLGRDGRADNEAELALPPWWGTN